MPTLDPRQLRLADDAACTICETLPPAELGAPVVLEAQGLRPGYAKRAILPPLSFQMREGEIWALFGPNGGGKSSLLRTLLDLQPPVEGSVQRARIRTSSVPQRQHLDALVPGRVIDIVRAGAERGWSFLQPWTTRAQRDAVERAIDDAEIRALLLQPFAELSEGQKQRVLIARALASEPGLLALDEPTSAMDPFHEEAVFRLLEKVARTRKLAVLVASHHMHILTECAHKAVYVDRERGVVASGRFEEVAAHPTVVARYGDLMSVRPCHNLGETHRHLGPELIHE